MKRSSSSVGPTLLKRQCYGIDPSPIQMAASGPSSSKRRRTASIQEANRTNPFPLPQMPQLDKAVYSKHEVQAMLEEMEHRYSKQLDEYCASVFDILYPNKICTEENSNHHMAYIS
jgi:hypothetical protein